ncbi:MAG: M6 family metalloprotease domain-containing protein [Bacteroidales bacterium]|nr:M6 family metalloprotease domain-containing protein [Bacteroidales bacterium]
MKQKFLTLLALGVMLCSQTLFAVPAKQGLLTITQPDGTTIQVYIMGDERMHLYRTSDNYTLLSNSDGVLEYAKLDAKGNLIPSGIKAHNPQERTLTEMVALNQIEIKLDYSSSQKKMIREIARKVFDVPNENKGQAVEGVTIGRRRALIILVAYSDVAFTYTQQEFDNLFNQVNYNVGGASGSVRDFFLASSFGQLELLPTVVGPYTLPHDMAFYGANNQYGNDANARQMIIDACTAANADVDFKQFDGNNDGFVDGVHVIFAGLGEAAGGAPNTIWPHRSSLNPPQSFDGVRVKDYSCSAEKRQGGSIAGIGTIAHELGHVLGLPDYYDTDYGASGGYARTPGRFDIMDQGSYNNNENTPPLYCAFSRLTLGWIEPYVLEDSTNMDITVFPLIDSNEAFMIKTSTDGDYFIFENRQRNNVWDNYIFGDGGYSMNFNGGLLVMHANENIPNNNDSSALRLRIVRADGIESGYYSNSWYATSIDNDVYPGSSNITDFWANDGAEPSGSQHSILDAKAHVSNIARLSDGTITFKLGQGAAYSNETKTFAATNVDFTSATLNGSVTVNSTSGNNTIIEKGFVYSSSQYPTINQSTKVIVADAADTMTNNVTGLSQGVTYYYRAYSINQQGVTYGGQENFMTLSPAITNNFIVDSNYAACRSGEVPTLSGSLPQGGNGEYKYAWLQSTDGINFVYTDNSGIKQDYMPSKMDNNMYFKRIVYSADKIDTSDVKLVPIVDSTIVGFVTADKDTISKGGIAELTISQHEGNIMFWQKRESSGSWEIISNTVNVNPLDDSLNNDGTYQYRARIQNGACPGKMTSSVNVVVVDGVGLSDVDNEAIDFDVYPNPAHNEIALTFNEQKSRVDMFILDLTGRIVYHKDAVHSEQKINISAIAQGSYFVVLQSNGKVIGKRQIVTTK